MPCVLRTSSGGGAPGQCWARLTLLSTVPDAKHNAWFRGRHHVTVRRLQQVVDQVAAGSF